MMKVKYKDLLGSVYIVVFIALLEPSGFKDTMLHSILGMVRVGAFAISFIYLIAFRLYKEKSVLVVALLVGWMTVTTLLYSKTLSDDFIYNNRNIITAIIFSAYMIKKYPKHFVVILALILSSWIFLDGITWKVSGVSTTRYGQASFFLGTKTTITYYLIPAFIADYAMLSIIKGTFRKAAIFLFAITIGGAIVYLINQPISTCIICLALEIVALFFVKRANKAVNAVCKYGFVVLTAVNILVITGNVLGFLNNFVTQVLRESGDFNGRFQIWEMVLANIVNRPIVGYGYSSGIRFNAWHWYNTSTHNMLLYILFSMGIIGLVLFGIIIFMIHKRCRSNYTRNSLLAKFSILSLNVIAFESISESCAYNVQTICAFMIMLSMGTYVALETGIINR